MQFIYERFFTILCIKIQFKLKLTKHYPVSLFNIIALCFHQKQILN